MVGGKGHDRYLVDSAGDKMTEAAGQGDDPVLLGPASYTLGANVETPLFLVDALNLSAMRLAMASRLIASPTSWTAPAMIPSRAASRMTP